MHPLPCSVEYFQHGSIVVIPRDERFTLENDEYDHEAKKWRIYTISARAQEPRTNFNAVWPPDCTKVFGGYSATGNQFNVSVTVPWRFVPTNTVRPSWRGSRAEVPIFELTFMPTKP